MAAGCNCKAAIGCVDARAPVRRASYVSLYKWPESDAEFVKSVAMARRQGGGGGGGQESPGGASASSYYYYGHYNGSGSMRSNSGELSAAAAAGYCCSPRVVDSYSCRQMYLRSYTFSKRKETVPERTMACLGRVRERGAAAVFPLFLPQRHGGGSSSSTAAGSVGSASNRIAGVARGESRDDREDDDELGLRGSKLQGRKSRRRRRRKKGCAVVRRLHQASCGAVRVIFRRLLACTTSVDVADGAGAPPQP